MKVAITAQGKELTAPIDPRFGRAQFFIVVDTESNEATAVDNSINLHAAQGAGIQSGKRVVELGVDALITGHVGPKAFSTLQAGHVAVYNGAEGTVSDALTMLRDGKLTKIEAADVPGHWV